MKTQNTTKRLPAVVLAELENLGILVRGARLRQQWTQKNLAERAAISITTLQRLEKGNPNISFSAVAMICWLLNIPWKLQLDLGEAEYLKAIAEGKKRAKLSWREHLDNQF